MINLVEALSFRCLRNVRQPLDRFQILVGPNSSGKTTFLDVISFLGDALSDGLEEAVERRTGDPRDLIWGKSGCRFELAVEARIPSDLRQRLPESGHATVRYEVAIKTEPELAFEAERVLLLPEIPEADESVDRQLSIFPMARAHRDTLLTRTPKSGIRTIVNKVPSGNDNYYSETYNASGKGWQRAFKLGPKKSALANLPEDESEFPVATWVKRVLADGVQPFVLNSLAIRRASPRAQRGGFKADGSNLPWVVAQLESAEGDTSEELRDEQQRLAAWVRHVQTALPDLEAVRTVEREDDRHRYIMLRYRGGLEVPSWMASDGTLRLLALTLPAYLPSFRGVYLIEEPENGLHPMAVDTAFQSLSSTYDAQILVATHSPVMLSLAQPDQVLCFAKTPNGETSIVRGDEHPALRDWKGDVDFGTLFASGILN